MTASRDGFFSSTGNGASNDTTLPDISPTIIIFAITAAAFVCFLMLLRRGRSEPAYDNKQVGDIDEFDPKHVPTRAEVGVLLRTGVDRQPKPMKKTGRSKSLPGAAGAASAAAAPGSTAISIRL